MLSSTRPPTRFVLPMKANIEIMTLRASTIPVPPRSTVIFTDGITHPDLWLWDAWTCTIGSTISLFTLAIARTDALGRETSPALRNEYPFHIRRFTSQNGGRTWRDEGAYLGPIELPGSATEHNMWSGSVLPYGDELIVGYTGIRKIGDQQHFHQSICITAAALDGMPPDISSHDPISDPLRDYDEIIRAGYYLGPKDQLGADDGEEGGPILAWRDPFLLPMRDGSLRAFWAAKVSPRAPAVAVARVVKQANGFALDKLLPPIELPDGADFTQAEVPKVYTDQNFEKFCMILSTCNRLHEDQPDEEVSKELRLYVANDLNGPWIPFHKGSSIIPGVEHLFGGSLENVDFHRGTATLIAPFTEMAAKERQLTFAPVLQISLGDLIGGIDERSDMRRGG